MITLLTLLWTATIEMSAIFRFFPAITWFTLGLLVGRHQMLHLVPFDLSFLKTVDVSLKSGSHQHAIIIPYRNRTYHLKVIKQYLSGYLLRKFPRETFSLWVIEQYNSNLFNRGWLANVGIKLATELYPKIQCIIFHDVDMIPKNETVVPYNECNFPLQLGSELQHWKWGVPYQNYAGGVVSMNVRHWHQINGFSNDFEGWGGEDDDLFERLKVNELLDNDTKTIRRPIEGCGVFNTISEARQHHPEKVKGNNEYKRSLQIIGEMQRGSNRWKSDGLSDLTFRILGFENASSLRTIVTCHHVRVVP